MTIRVSQNRFCARYGIYLGLSCCLTRHRLGTGCARLHYKDNGDCADGLEYDPHRQITNRLRSATFSA